MLNASIEDGGWWKWDEEESRVVFESSSPAYLYTLLLLLQQQEGGGGGGLSIVLQLAILSRALLDGGMGGNQTEVCAGGPSRTTKHRNERNRVKACNRE